VLKYLLADEYPTTLLSSKLCPAYNPSVRTVKKTLLLIVSIVACTAIGADPAENTAFQLVHWLAGRCLASAVVSFVSQSLPSNRPIHHIAPSLRLFVPESLQVYRHFFFSEGCVCEVCDLSHLPSLWLTSHGDYSPTASAAPSLRLLILRGSLIKCQSRCTTIILLFSNSAGKISESGLCSYIFSSYSVCSLFFWFIGGWLLHNVLTLIFHGLMEVPSICFMTFSSTVCLKVLLSVSCFPDVIALLGLGSLYRCCIPVASDISSQMSVHLRFHLQHCPWSNFSVVSFWTSILYDSVPYALQEWHGGTSICRRRPTSSRTH
jgi:hypothetical protein